MTKFEDIFNNVRSIVQPTNESASIAFLIILSSIILLCLSAFSLLLLFKNAEIDGLINREIEKKVAVYKIVSAIIICIFVVVRLLSQYKDETKFAEIQDKLKEKNIEISDPIKIKYDNEYTTCVIAKQDSLVKIIKVEDIKQLETSDLHSIGSRY